MTYAYHPPVILPDGSAYEVGRRAAAEAHAQYRPATGHADLAAWLDPFGEVWLLPAISEPAEWRRLYVRDEAGS